MSMLNRLDWSRQVAALNERIKTFQTDPGKEQFDAAIAAMREYAEAVQTGGIEVPQRFIAS
jgi:hypothetical protein